MLFYEVGNCGIRHAKTRHKGLYLPQQSRVDYPIHLTVNQQHMKNKNLFIGILIFAIGLNLLSIDYNDFFNLKVNGISMAFTLLSVILLIYYLFKK